MSEAKKRWFEARVAIAAPLGTAHATARRRAIGRACVKGDVPVRLAIESVVFVGAHACGCG